MHVTPARLPGWAGVIASNSVAPLPLTRLTLAERSDTLK
jgi:hypothetical protein